MTTLRSSGDLSSDLAAVRERFPALAAHPDIVHADAPGGTQVLDSALDALRDAAIHANANTHGSFATSRRVDSLNDDARDVFAAFMGSQPESIVFGPNMTTLAFHLSHALDELLATGGEIVCTGLDHDANVSPWLGLAERTGAPLSFVPLAVDGTLDVGALDDLVTERTRLITFPRASNALGTLVDPAPFVAAARRVGARTIMDAVHSAPHVPIDRLGDGIDVVLCSPYKFFGPHSGVMAADPDLLAAIQPDKVRPSPDEGPERWQTGTASFESIAAAVAAARYVTDEVGYEAIMAHERALSAAFLDGLAARADWTLHGPPTQEGRTPTFAVTHDSLSPQDVAAQMGEAGINCWAGHYYAVEPMRRLGLLDRGGAVRIGFVHYHSTDDVERVLRAMDGVG